MSDNERTSVGTKTSSSPEFITLEEAAAMTYFLESSATAELAVRTSGDSALDIEYSAAEAAERAVTSGAIIERMWSYLTYGDEEYEDI